MPPVSGEERVATVFADIHYYFTAPTPRPLHHRFDKGCYLYIYHNATRQTTRLEIANNPGTPDQDAFQGSLDGVKIRCSHKFPTLLTVIVDANDRTTKSASSSPKDDINDPQEWRLASADPRDQGQYKYRLHTLDIYLWTREDAKGVIETSKRLLRPEQIEILDAPSKSSKGHGAVSPVVQQLENVAITDPAYTNGQTRNSQNQAATLPPPPPLKQESSTRSASSSTPRTSSAKSTEASTNYAPMAYNPAAPAAPEPIAHREKTPPPADDGDSTGLATAAYTDHTQTYADQRHSQVSSPTPGQSQSASSQYGSPPPPQPGSANHGSPLHSAYATPPSGHTFQHAQSMTSVVTPESHRTPGARSQAVSPTGAASPAGRQPLVPQQTVYGAPSPQQDPNAHLYATQQHQQQQDQQKQSQYPQSLKTPPPPQMQPQDSYRQSESPSAQVYGLSQQPQPHQPIPHLQPQYADYLQSQPGYHHHPPPHQSQLPPQPPMGGYSQYSYAQPPQQAPHHHHHHSHHHPHEPHQHQHQHQYQGGSGGGRYDVHNQLYRPTEEEDKNRHRRSDNRVDAKKPSGRLEATAGKVDKRIGGFLKKLDKKL